MVGCPRLSVYTRYFPLSTHKSQAERWEAAVATLRSLFLECCFLQRRFHFNLPFSTPVSQGAIAPEGWTSGKPLHHRVQVLFPSQAQEPPASLLCICQTSCHWLQTARAIKAHCKITSSFHVGPRWCGLERLGSLLPPSAVLGNQES